MVDATHHGATHGEEDGQTRRDFLYLAAGAVGAVGAAGVAWALVDSMNPASDTLSLSSIDVPLDKISEGMGIAALWQGKPIYVRHRTAQEITEAENVKLSELIDPWSTDNDGNRLGTAEDKERVQKSPWLVLIGICTHLGCLPLGNKPTDMRGDWGGYFCPCHGSQYDTSGRVRHGPAPLNLHLPPYKFVSDTVVRVG
jgi:ubiquinol-cytochrome c reductase iron-sulfur subunit